MGFQEGLDTISNDTSESINTKCPNLLIRKDNSLLLYNSNEPIVDGVNPIPFSTMDQYITHVQTERNNGKKCPILYLQSENDVQGKDVYRTRPSPFDNAGGLPVTHYTDASRENGEYNSNQYHGFDPTNQYVGRYTVIDKIHDSTKTENGKLAFSDNPMDSNWGGVLYTQSKIDSGKYDDNIVTRPIYANAPNTFANTLPFKQEEE